MNKRVGFFGLMVAAAVGFVSPAVASAQNRYDCRPGYVVHEYRGRDWRAPVPVFRERPEWRERVYIAPRYAPVYREGFRRPEPRPGLGWYGR